jgi:hypothetical protein
MYAEISYMYRKYTYEVHECSHSLHNGRVEGEEELDNVGQVVGGVTENLLCLVHRSNHGLSVFCRTEGDDLDEGVQNDSRELGLVKERVLLPRKNEPLQLSNGAQLLPGLEAGCPALGLPLNRSLLIQLLQLEKAGPKLTPTILAGQQLYP